jgi:hypothetical protein
MLPPLARQPEVDEMIDGGFYFVLHAPRQSGKTTFLKSQVDKINSEGVYYALYCTLELIQGESDVSRAMDWITSVIKLALSVSNVEELTLLTNTFDTFTRNEPPIKIIYLFNSICSSLTKDLVVFFDEADCLAEGPLITFLRQIRVGYNNRQDGKKTKFPRSMALVGMRDIRDYLSRIRPEAESHGVASPFNIKKDSLTLANFSLREIEVLYRQHAEATEFRQTFLDSALDRAWHWSEGQPWLVNALANEAVVKILKKDYQTPVTGAHIDQAAENLIQRRDVHIDSLLERLKEPRVYRIMDSVFAGTVSSGLDHSDDRKYCLDLGLVVSDGNGCLRPANSLYKEVMSRVITDQIQSAMDKLIDDRNGFQAWTEGEGAEMRLKMNTLLEEFQKFWRQHSLSFPLRVKQLDKLNSESLISELNLQDSFEENITNLKTVILRIRHLLEHKYDEAAYSFILMSFLQRLVNGGALVLREYAQGRRSVDLCIIFNKRKYFLEMKIKGQKKLEDSLDQLAGYLNAAQEKEGWLVIFDPARNENWDKKLYYRQEIFNNIIIHIFGC